MRETIRKEAVSRLDEDDVSLIDTTTPDGTGGALYFFRVLPVKSTTCLAKAVKQIIYSQDLYRASHRP